MKSVPHCNGSRLKLLRQKLGISQNSLAEVLSVDRVTIARWETGERECKFSLPQVAALCCLLKKADMTVDQLMDSHL